MPEVNALRRAMRFRECAPPPLDNLAANMRWLRDRELIGNLYKRYAYGVDSIDFDLVRSVFHPECEVVGTVNSGALDDYLAEIERGLHRFEATMHFVGNQYIEIDGDTGFVESWVTGYHMQAEDSAVDHLVLGLRYQDDVARNGDDWWITRRVAVKQWHTGPFPRANLSDPIDPDRASG